MSRLSSPISDLKNKYEVVVIGSGYGGSIAASRMSRLGKQVCLLEKGKEFMPGEFPTDITSASKEMQITSKGKTQGAKNGLYEFVINEDISVFKGCGLGGTSLVNANVSIEPEDRVFDDKCWPQEIRDDLNSLKEGIAKAREMLKPNPYPEGKNNYPELCKTKAARMSAEKINEKFELLDINVNFEDKINHVGVRQKKCINCGDCVTGCNHEAKNTTQMNYLPDAKNHGAEIFTEVDVKYIERAENVWLIYFEIHHSDREKFDAPLMFIKADMIFLSAGSLGSTEILLRSAKKGLPVSDLLGKRFTGNGDVLSFGFNNDIEIHGIGLGEKAEEGKIANVGPCITSAIDIRNKPLLDEGMIIEEGSIPGPLSSVLVPAFLTLSAFFGKDTDYGFSDFLREKLRILKSFFGGPYKGALDHTQIYLVMTHDDGNGSMRLDSEELTIHWENVGKQKIFTKVNDKLKDATKALGGTFIKNPAWNELMDYDLVTVHPLGGCIMGKNSSSGVVNHKGQVYSTKGEEELYPGLYVMDGAIIPRPLGTNPLLTISGLAERNCKLIAEEMGLKLNYDFHDIEERTENQTTGIQFTEKMTGYFFSDMNENYDRAFIMEDYQKAYEKGKEINSDFEFTLTILTQDANKFISDKDHEAGMTGTVKASALSDEALTISNGKFNLFVINSDEPGKKKMKYSMNLHSKEGKVFFFKGYKDIYDDKGIDVWTDTSVLFITIYEGESEASPVIGKGILKIKLDDLAKQLTTMKALNTKNHLEGLSALTKFKKLFAGDIADTFFRKI